MQEYRYCAIRPMGFASIYSYIADDDLGEVRIGMYVLVPFGRENNVVKGEIMDVGMFTEENAPFPVPRTKHILSIVEGEAYDEGEYDEEYDDEDYDEDDYDEDDDETDTSDSDEDMADALDAVRHMILTEDYQGIFDWAYQHEDCVDDPEVMAMVIHCYEICVEQNNPLAALNLGTHYYNGRGVKQNYKKAAELYEIAASVGELRALCNLGYCYLYGRHQDPDYDKALHYFQLGAMLYDDPNCLYKVGDMYYKGLGVEQNKKIGWLFYIRALKACESDEEKNYCRADVLLRIGKGYLSNEVVVPNPELALHCLTQALNGFYARRKTDPFVRDLIFDAKLWIEKAEEALDSEIH